MEQQISCMEDELSEARLESSKLKTELVSERTTWEVKLSELHSRINEVCSMISYFIVKMLILFLVGRRKNFR